MVANPFRAAFDRTPRMRKRPEWNAKLVRSVGQWEVEAHIMNTISADHLDKRGLRPPASDQCF